MAKTSAPVSYSADLGLPPDPPAAVAIPGDTERRGRSPMEKKADATMLYLHPAGKKQLRLYAVEAGVKVHDILIDAIEAWGAAHGLTGPFRVPPVLPPRRRQ